MHVSRAIGIHRHDLYPSERLDASQRPVFRIAKMKISSRWQEPPHTQDPGVVT